MTGFSIQPEQQCTQQFIQWTGALFARVGMITKPRDEMNTGLWRV
jgi:hypothetical protein